MLKFQDDYSTLIVTFNDFILLVYTIIDDLYKKLVPLLFHKGEMLLLQKCLIPKSLP